MSDYTVLLFYKYVKIDNPEQVKKWQADLCLQLGLKGRIIIATEGINTTVEGLAENIEKYIKETEKDERFLDIHYKKSSGNGKAFPKLSVKVRTEIVTSHFDGEISPEIVTGKYITPEELHTWFEQKKQFYIIDMRNDYEHKSGFFENSILPKNLKNFRDLPSILPEIEHLKNETVVTVCTGGVRCEKASGFLVKHGFSDVHQLYGGIVSYMEKYPNQHFKGKLYVFDQRIVMGFNTDDASHEVVGKCEMCGKSSENYINIRSKNGPRRHVICCEECIAKREVTLD